MSDEEVAAWPLGRPTVGRVMHYEKDEADGVHNAAMVTQVHTAECVDLVVFEPGGFSFRTLVLHAGVGARPGYDTGTWHWPERD